MNAQKGFTLIELMIVVAIIGILAAIALPAYQDYTARSKMAEPMTAASACKGSVSEFIQANQSFPADAGQAGCEQASKYVKAITVSDTDGTVSVEIQNINADVDGKMLQLQPTSDAARKIALTKADEGIQGWSCGTDADAADYKYFPASCRQAPLGGL